MFSYLVLTIQNHMEYEGDAWLGYDRQRAASTPQAGWEKSDSTLWDMAFSGKARTNHCHHYFSLSHKSSECEWSPKVARPVPQPLMASFKQQVAPETSSCQNIICKSFHFDPRLALRIAATIMCVGIAFTTHTQRVKCTKQCSAP